MATLGYLATFACFTIHIVNTKRLLLKLGLFILALSFLLQTSGMVYRWIEAGYMEVLASEKALGYKLYGLKWLTTFLQHPPWSNLYEIMMYMSWGLILVTMALELLWCFPWVRLWGILLALLALGIASLTDASIKPLVPALKSWWIMIHVISASIAYASGFMAAFLCLGALMKHKEQVMKTRILALSLIMLGLLMYFLGGGLELIMKQHYLVKVLALAGDHITPVFNWAHERKVFMYTPMPLVGYLLFMAVIFNVMTGALLLGIKRINHYANLLFLLSFLLSIIILMMMFFHDTIKTAVIFDNITSSHLSHQGPYFMGFKSHIWGLFLMIFLVLMQGILCGYAYYSKNYYVSLPSKEVLETASYKVISLSFFLMTVVLITGALWAHYAWGRYWAWDPKETGALAIWLNYAIYLHARRTKGLSGSFASLIGVIGFMIIIIGFLGVNLGMFAEGLHTYGQGY